MRRVIPLLLALILLVLTGCGRNAGGPAENTPSKPGASEAVPAPAETAPAKDNASNSASAGSAAYNEALRAYKYVLGHNEALEEFLAGAAESGKALSPSRFALLDVDADALPEVVIELSDGYPYYYQVLRYEDGDLYEHTLALRQFNELKEDGTFSWSGGAGDNGYGRLRFDGGEYAVENIAHIATSLEGDEAVISYYIGGEPVTREQYEAFAARQAEKPAAPWRDFTQENIDAVFSQ